MRSKEGGELDKEEGRSEKDGILLKGEKVYFKEGVSKVNVSVLYFLA